MVQLDLKNQHLMRRQNCPNNCNIHAMIQISELFRKSEKTVSVLARKSPGQKHVSNTKQCCHRPGWCAQWPREIRLQSVEVLSKIRAIGMPYSTLNLAKDTKQNLLIFLHSTLWFVVDRKQAALLAFK